MQSLLLNAEKTLKQMHNKSMQCNTQWNAGSTLPLDQFLMFLSILLEETGAFKLT